MALRSKAKTDLLKSVPLFEHCSRRELGKIAGITDEIAVDDGKVLITEGDRGREFFVIISGEVEVRRRGQEARDPRARHLLRRDRAALAAAAHRNRDGAHAAPRPRDRRPGLRRPPRRDARAVAQGRPVAGGAGRGRRAGRLGPRRRRVALLGATVLDRAPDQQPDPGEDRDDRHDPGDEKDSVHDPVLPGRDASHSRRDKRA